MQLYNTILEMINNNNYSNEKINNILKPISTIADHIIFKDYITNIVEILTRNDTNINNLKILSRDSIGVRAFITSILLIIRAIPDLKFEYDPESIEEILFKALVYIFLIIMPTYINQEWTPKEILILALLFYKKIKFSGITFNIINRIHKWFEPSFNPNCMVIAEQNIGIIHKHLPHLLLDLTIRMYVIKKQSKMESKIGTNKRQLFEKNKKIK